MRTFGAKQKLIQPIASVLSTMSRPTRSTQDQAVNSILHPRRTSATPDTERTSQTNSDELGSGVGSSALGPFVHDFARIPVHRATAGALQRKLAIGKPGDEYEQEADRISERVTRTTEPQLQRACACGGDCSKCRAKDPAHAHGRLQTKRIASSNAEQVSVPPIVHDVLRSSGRPLDAATRSLMSPHFGVEFSDVRIHTDTIAAESARAVDALAYTVGRNVVFGADQYQPSTRDGQRLLAHELTHVMQQNQAPALSLQRACRSAAQCAAPSPGSGAKASADVAADSNAKATASGGVAAAPGGVVSCTLPRHGLRATKFEALATGAVLGATLAPGIDGFFINACLSDQADGANGTCAQFPGGPPAGTHPDHHCVQIHASAEDDAIALLAKPKPLGDADLRRFLDITATVVHESQHSRFEASKAAIVPPAADCNLSSPVPNPPGTIVEQLLTEISAEVAEFDVFFKNSVANPSTSSTFAMQSAEHDIATRGGENILDNIKDLQCACSCGTADKFVEQVFTQASSTWSPAEKKEFKRAMTGFMPSFWPKSLQEK